MKSGQVILTGVGLVTIGLLTYMAFPSVNYFNEPTDLDYDELRIDASRLKELRERTGFETIILHSYYDKDFFWDEDDIHLAPTAWKNASGNGDYEWVTLENDEIFETTETRTFENVLVSRSVYQLGPEHIRYLTETISDAAYFKFIPESLRGSFINYRVAAFDPNNREIEVASEFRMLNPSPPARPR